MNNIGPEQNIPTEAQTQLPEIAKGWEYVQEAPISEQQRHELTSNGKTYVENLQERIGKEIVLIEIIDEEAERQRQVAKAVTQAGASALEDSTSSGKYTPLAKQKSIQGHQYGPLRNYYAVARTDTE